jgi:hypothetical protein
MGFQLFIQQLQILHYKDRINWTGSYSLIVAEEAKNWKPSNTELREYRDNQIWNALKHLDHEHILLADTSLGLHTAIQATHLEEIRAEQGTTSILEANLQVVEKFLGKIELYGGSYLVASTNPEEFPWQ